MSDRFSTLAPRDVAITLASLGRRFDGAAKAASAESRLVDLHDAPGPDGSSIRSILTEAAQALSFIGNELDRSVHSQEPVVPHAALDASERSFLENPGSPALEQSVDAISEAAAGGASVINDSSSDTLDRRVAVAGGSATTPIDLAREMARTGIALLNTADKQVEWLQSQR